MPKVICNFLKNFGGILTKIHPKNQQNFQKPVFTVELPTMVKQRRSLCFTIKVCKPANNVILMGRCLKICEGTFCLKIADYSAILVKTFSILMIDPADLCLLVDLCHLYHLWHKWQRHISIHVIFSKLAYNSIFLHQ